VFTFFHDRGYPGYNVSLMSTRGVIDTLRLRKRAHCLRAVSAPEILSDTDMVWVHGDGNRLDVRPRLETSTHGEDGSRPIARFR